jgi:predicted dehydrogenase
MARPVKIAIDGLSHGHVVWLKKFGNPNLFTIVGIAEADQNLASKMSKRIGFDMGLVFPDLKTLLENVKPEAVMAFNPVSEHLETVRACAPLGIHVMLEKPMATNYLDALEMAGLAAKNNIHLIVNYETTWYPTVHESIKRAQSGKLGTVRKAIVTTGHKGPAEINVGEEFLGWLTDSIKNGGGALMDFGCYGANLMTYLNNGELPKSVYAQSNNFKPNIYPDVDDDALIILDFDSMQAILLPSWNWAFSRKTMELYGTTGYVKAIDQDQLAYRDSRKEPEKVVSLSVEKPFNPFEYFIQVIEGSVKLEPHEPAAIQNNLNVMKILDAARNSASTGKVVYLNTL